MQEPVGENCTFFYQGLVSKGVVCNEDSRARTEFEGHNRTKFGMDGLEHLLKFANRVVKPKEFASDGQSRGPWGEFPGGIFGRSDVVEDVSEENAYWDRDEYDVPTFHFGLAVDCQ